WIGSVTTITNSSNMPATKAMCSCAIISLLRGRSGPASSWARKRLPPNKIATGLQADCILLAMSRLMQYLMLHETRQPAFRHIACAAAHGRTFRPDHVGGARPDDG